MSGVLESPRRFTHEYPRFLGKPDLSGSIGVVEYPKCDQAGDATLARGRLLAEQFDQHEEAAKEFERFAQEHPEANVPMPDDLKKSQ